MRNICTYYSRDPRNIRVIMGVESESHVLRWSRSRNIFFDPTLILIILYVNCLKMKVNNLHRIANILSYGVSVLLI